MIEAHGLTYRVGDAVLVDGVDLVVRSGEMVAVVGPNGAGKSTLLGLLGGDLRPTEGSVRLAGDDAADLTDLELAERRALLGQSSPTDIPFTAAEVVSLGRHAHRRDPDNSAERDAAAVADALRRTDVTHLGHRVYATLSGGERTRVSLSRILAQETPIVLLDEPTTALDVAHEVRVMAEVAALAGAGRTVVAVLHDLNAAAAAAGRVVVMSEAKVVADGEPRAVLTPDLLEQVYRHPMRVMEHPLGDGVLILPGR
jgi:iron complex transport system ATP-binding protein